MNLVRRREAVQNDYFIVKYLVDSTSNLMDAAEAIAFGQSVGNPKVRNDWETEEMFERYSCKIVPFEKHHVENPDMMRNVRCGHFEIAFPIANLNMNTDGISQLMCHIMGGQLDIDIIQTCKIVDIWFPEDFRKTYGISPTMGISGIRKYLDNHFKPILGGIVKPKIGMTPNVLLECVKEMVAGGVEFIKEDEILGDPSYCSLEDRTKLIQGFLHTVGRPIIYAYCINGDKPDEKIDLIRSYGANAFHYNFWGGLGQYRVMAQAKPDNMFMFFQKSGDKILTYSHNKFSIDWIVVCKLMEFMGVDFSHAGMIGGYYNGGEDIYDVLRILRELNIMPSLSCGMHPGLVESITKKIGYDYMANVGGATHGHPDGTRAGTKAMRQAIDGVYGDEYFKAIQKWGKL